jgi:type I restriction enzyme, S subunit
MGDAWARKRLDDIVELRRGFDLPSRLRQDGPYPVLSSGVTAGWHSKGPVSGPGFVIGRATNLGKPTWSNVDFWPLNTTLYAADFKGNDPRFLFHLFENLDLSGFDSGSVQPMLNRNYIAGIEVRIPGRSVQTAIANVLGALDDKIAANTRVSTRALALGDTIFERAAAGNVPPSATIGELADRSVLAFSDGYRTKRAEHGRPGIRILRAGDVRESSVYPTGDDYVAEEHSRQIGAKVSQPGDIVLTTKGTVGRVAVVGKDVEQLVYSPQVCYFRVLDAETLDRGYLAAWFRSKDLQRQCGMLMHKSDMAPYISLRDIRTLAIPLPPIDEQRRNGQIQLALLDAFGASCADTESLARTRDELLPLLMSGKVTVKAADQIVGNVT